jgi:hypothetical protein
VYVNRPVVKKRVTCSGHSSVENNCGFVSSRQAETQPSWRILPKVHRAGYCPLSPHLTSHRTTPITPQAGGGSRHLYRVSYPPLCNSTLHPSLQTQMRGSPLISLCTAHMASNTVPSKKLLPNPGPGFCSPRRGSDLRGGVPKSVTLMYFRVPRCRNSLRQGGYGGTSSERPSDLHIRIRIFMR